MQKHTLFNKLESNIELTVALPCYNGKRIGWLCLESLCNQQQVSFDWELVICEEKHEGMLGAEFFESYIERLASVRCVRVVYIALTEWVNLPKKWQLIGQNADENSKVFVLQAIDCYTPSLRLFYAYEWVARKHFDWMDFAMGYFYSFEHRKLILYSARALTNLHMAFATKYARNIPDTDKNKGIDGFLYKHIKSNVRVMKAKCLNVLLEDGLDTDGHNNISVNRINHYDKPAYPFQPTLFKLNDLPLPDNIKDRINESF